MFIEDLYCKNLEGYTTPRTKSVMTKLTIETLKKYPSRLQYAIHLHLLCVLYMLLYRHG